MNRTQAMSQEDRKHPFPLLLLLIGAVLLLWLGLAWLGSRSGPGDVATPGSPAAAPAPPPGDTVGNLSAQISGQRDLSANAAVGRPGGSATPPGPPVPDPNFPKTDDFDTSTALELAMQRPPGSVAGWVSDSMALPIADARVRLEFEQKGKDEKQPALESLSDGNGMFTIGGVPPGRWTVVAEKASYATQASTGIDVDSGEQSTVALVMNPELQLKGIVKAAGTPVDGAQVTAEREHLAILSTGEVNQLRLVYQDTTTDAKGEFTLKQLPKATMLVTGWAPGYARVEREVEVVDKAPVLEIVLEPEALLAGQVRGPRGEPVADAELMLLEPGTTDRKKPRASTKSERAGGFIFRSLPAGRRFDLYAKAALYAEVGPIPVQTGTSNNIIVMDTGGNIEGKVTDFSSGRTVPNVGVVAIMDGAALSTALWTRTNRDGEYRITRLPAGTYSVAIVSEVLTSEAKTGVKVTVGKTVPSVDFVVYPGVTIGGMVLEGTTRQRIGGAVVKLASRVGPHLLTARNSETATAEDGSFTFQNMPKGVYTMTAEKKGFTPGVGEQASVRVEALIGVTPPPVELFLYQGGVITGEVVSQSGPPIPGAIVQLFHAPNSPGRVKTEKYTTKTDTAGKFEILGLPLDADLLLQVSAWAPGFSKASSDPLLLNRDQPERYTQITIGSGIDVPVIVLTSMGGPIGEATVSATHASFTADPSPPAWSGKTTNNGTILLRQLPPGRVRVGASAPNFRSNSKAVDIALDKEVEPVELRLEPAFVLTGRVLDDRGEVIAGRVSARPMPGSSGSGSADLKPDGSFRIDTLGTGTFFLDVTVRRPTPAGTRQLVWTIPDVAPNNGFGEVVFRVPLNGTVSGQVLSPDGDQTPVKYTISLSAKYVDAAGITRAFGTSASFDKNSAFRMESLPPGVYTLGASATDYLPLTVGPFEVVSPGDHSVGVLKFLPGGRLKARVINAITKEPVASVVLRLQPDGPTGKTDGNGNVGIGPILPSMYSVQFEHPHYLPLEKRLIKISRGQENDIGVIELDPGGTLTGMVVDGDNKPQRSITVEATAVNADVVRRTNTDAGGRFTFRGLTPGGQRLVFTGTVNGRRVTKLMDVTVSATRETEIDVMIWANSRLSGRLVPPPGVDASRARVTLYPMRFDNVPVISGAIPVPNVFADGFEVEFLEQGYYLVTVQAPGPTKNTVYWSGLAPVLDRNARAVVRAGRLAIRGRILSGPGGTPVKKQPVRIDLLSSPQTGTSQLSRWWRFNTVTDNDGVFVFQNLEAGTYSLVAQNEGLGSDILEIINLSSNQPVTQVTYSFRGE